MSHSGLKINSVKMHVGLQKVYGSCVLGKKSAMDFEAFLPKWAAFCSTLHQLLKILLCSWLPSSGERARWLQLGLRVWQALKPCASSKEEEIQSVQPFSQLLPLLFWLLKLTATGKASFVMLFTEKTAFLK